MSSRSPSGCSGRRSYGSARAFVRQSRRSRLRGRRLRRPLRASLYRRWGCGQRVRGDCRATARSRPYVLAVRLGNRAAHRRYGLRMSRLFRNSRYVGRLSRWCHPVIPSSRRPCAQCRPAFHLSSESLHRRLSARELPLKACSVPASGRSRSRGRFRTASRASALRPLSASSDLGRISHPAVARNASAARPRRAAAAEAQNRVGWRGPVDRVTVLRDIGARLGS